MNLTFTPSTKHQVSLSSSIRPLLGTEVLDETTVHTVVWAGTTIHGAPKLTGPPAAAQSAYR